MPIRTTQKKDLFLDDLDINVVRVRSRYTITVEHRPTRLQVEQGGVKWCKLYRTKEGLIEDLKKKVGGKAP